MIICSALDTESAIWLLRNGKVDVVLIPGVPANISWFAVVDPVLAEDQFETSEFRRLVPAAVIELPGIETYSDHGSGVISVALSRVRVAYHHLFIAFLTHIFTVGENSV